MDFKNFTVRKPGSSVVVYIFFEFFLLIIFFMLLKDFDNPNNRQAALMIIPFFLIFSILIVMWFRWKITVNDDQITVSPYFGSEETFNFDYISRVKHVSKSTQFATSIECFTAYCGGRELFTVTSVCQDAIVLIALLKAKGVNIEWKTREFGEYIDKRTEEFLNMIKEERERKKNQEEGGPGFYEV